MAIPASELDKKFAAFRKQKSLQTSPGQALAAAVRSPREARRNISGGQNAMIELFEAAEVRKALSTMLEPRAVFEVRALDAQFKGERRKAIIAGYFDDPSICVLQLSRLQSATGI